MPTVLPAPAEREGRRDLGRVGAGLIVLGLLGFVGVVLALGGGARLDLDGVLVVGGGAILVVVIGTVLAASGKREGNVATGLLGGCTAALMGVVLGGLLVVATILYAIQDCAKACSGSPSQQQRR